MGRGRRTATGRLASTVAALGLVPTAGALSAAPTAAEEFVAGATFSGVHEIPETPSDPEFPLLTPIRLNVPFPDTARSAMAIDVEVTVRIDHPRAQDIDLYLSRPVGWDQMITLMSDVGGNNALDDVQFTFDDHAPARLTGLPGEGSRHRPNNLGSPDADDDELSAFDISDSLHFITGPGALDLWGATNDFNHAGEWRLYAIDDDENDLTGAITYAEIRVTFGAANGNGTMQGVQPIVIPQQGAAGTYPAVVDFFDNSPTGEDYIQDGGTIRNLAVHLDGLSHSSPDDLRIVLRGPNGAVAVLLAASGVDAPTNGSANLRFVHGGPALPADQPMRSGTYGPTVGAGASDQLLVNLVPGSGLGGPQTGGLDQFVGISPAGEWELFVYDSVMGDAGRIERWGITLDLNGAPDAADDSYSVDEDGDLVVNAPGVLGNDDDPESDGLTAQIASSPSHGTVVLDDDGSFTYTPTGNFHGPDSFTYRVSDGELTDTATVRIEVEPVNDAPTAVDDAYDATEDEPLVVDAEAAGLLANDSDLDGDDLTAALLDGPANGTVTVHPDGTFSYTPNPDFAGEDSFRYEADDGEAATAATVTIDVAGEPDAPEAADDAYLTGEDEVLVVPAGDGVLANDTDADGDPLSATVGDQPANGSVDLATDGSFTYTPHPDFVGTDTFTYTAGDGGLSSEEATVTIEVGPNIQDPPIAVDDRYDGTEDTVLTVDEADGVLSNDVDADLDSLTVEVGTPPATGTLDLQPDGSFTYTPAPNVDGEVTFTYVVSDGLDTDAATVTIDLAAVPDDPVANPDDFEIEEDGILVVDGDGVLANDTDGDGDVLFALVDDGPEHGTLVLDPDGGLTYVPDADYHGTDSFTYVASDVNPGGGQVTAAATSAPATVEITVTAVNDPPVAVDDTAAVDAGDSVTVDVLANDSDVDGDDLTLRLLDGPARGTATCDATSCTFDAPVGDPGGEVTFTYEIDDGAGATDTATVTVDVAAATPPASPGGSGTGTGSGSGSGSGGGGPLVRTGGDVGLLVTLAAALLFTGAVSGATGAATRRRYRPAHARR